ncbi:MAG: hypothetical protein WCJ58_00215 [bacterium]
MRTIIKDKFDGERPSLHPLAMHIAGELLQGLQLGPTTVANNPKSFLRGVDRFYVADLPGSILGGNTSMIQDVLDISNKVNQRSFNNVI